MTHIARTIAVVLAAAFVAPSAAQSATTVSRSGGAFAVTGDDTPSRIAGGDYTAAQFVDETGAAVLAGSGCMQVNPSTVDCGTFPAGATITVQLGAGDDYYKRATVDAVQTVDGGEGNDTIETGNGNDIVRGGPGNDDLTGGRGDDDLDGGAGNDKVDGWDGSDRVTGGPGVDTLLGDGSTIYSGGNDTIFARDGETDSVDCGGGADKAEADAADVVAGCAVVDRPSVPGGGGSGTPPTTGGSGGPTSTPAPTVAGSITKRRKPAELAAGKKISVRLTASAACNAAVAVGVSKTEAKRLKLGSKALTLGTSPSTPLAAGQATTVSVAIDRKYRSKVRKAAKVSTTLIVACAAADGQTFTGGLKATFKR